MDISFIDIEHLVIKYLEGAVPPERIEIIHERGNERGGLIRIFINQNESVIVKLWRIRNIKERVKSLTGLSNGAREWKMNEGVFKTGIKMPKPLCFKRIRLTNSECFEMMIIQDLGKTTSGVPFLKKVMMESDAGKQISFEDFITNTTRLLLKNNIVDIDNQLNNFLVDESGGFWRIDFECSYKHRIGFMAKYKKIIMLERLFRSYIHAEYPEESKTADFMSKVAESISISDSAKKRIVILLRNELERERSNCGISYSFSIKW